MCLVLARLMTPPRSYIWNATDGSFVKRLDGHKAAVSCCSWSELDILVTGQRPRFIVFLFFYFDTHARARVRAQTCIPARFVIRASGDRQKTLIVWGQ
jgi:WD40 repeat protein